MNFFPELSEDDKILNILEALDKSVLKAVELQRLYEPCHDLRSAIVSVFTVYKDFYNKPHEKAYQFGL